MASRPLRPGDELDGFRAVDAEGRTVTSTELTEGGPLVVYFFVKAKSPG